jgi:S1-C subfamily serine protease
MFRTGTLLAVLALAAMLAAPAGAQEDAKKPDWKALLKEKSDSVVAIKFVIQIKVMMGGQVVQDAEQNQELRGTLINDKGLVMAANSNFFPRVPPNARFQLEVGQPQNLKILFGNEEKEYDAQIVAKDTKLDLIFVQIMELGDRKISHIGLAGELEPEIGQELFTTTRLPRGFDNAPVLGRVLVTGEVEKPRRMWSMSGTIAGPGMPVFNFAGEAIGVISNQEASAGVGAGGQQSRPFILPLKTIKAQLKMAEDRAAKAIEKAAEEKELEKEGEGEGESEGDTEGDEKPEDKPEDKPEEKPADKPADEPKPE